MSVAAPACSFVIFGITGDLAARKLLPALFALHCQGSLHPQTRIVGYARSDWSDEQLRDEMRAALQEHDAQDFDEEHWQTLAPRFSFVRGGYDAPEDFRALAAHLAQIGHDTRIFYTATPPATYENIVRGLEAAGLGCETEGGAVRLVIEKPFGHDLASAKELNSLVLDTFSERQIYRIDHYLAKETAQNLAVLRFANTLFEPIWDNTHIDHVQITMAEEVGIEERGSFYEQAGVIRDVFQNHLLQLAALVAMEPPARYDATSLRNEKVKVFHAMDCVRPEDAVIGQYTASDRGGERLKGYREEEGVAPDSCQGSYAAVEFRIRNWRWAAVPFFVRSGKRLETKATEIVLHFKTPPHVPFSLNEDLKADRLILRVVPDEGISVRFNAKKPGQSTELKRVSMDFYYDREFERPNPDAYETLLLDVMQGDATLFMRADEVEAQWRIVQPLLDVCEGPDRQPVFYPAGSWGPDEAYRMLERQGRYWHRPGNGNAKG